MQVPTRKYDKIPRSKPDPAMTEEKYQELSKKLEILKTLKRPREAEEVKRLALMGDFSENAGYQLAKSRLRGINQRIIDIENLLNRAEIIKASNDKDSVQLGHKVTVETANKIKTYKILGSVETNPDVGIISHNSPLGVALLGCRVGEIIKVQVANKEKTYKIIGIE
ncbi:MAG: GreA/GreB family elongation factor [Candidatus Falkowbacteria bacterium]|nr:GreA/GreB family elongation factor [Candidatus Falkowbacteria bacterium]